MGSSDLNSLGAFDPTNSAHVGSDDQKPIDQDTSNCGMHNAGLCPNRAAEFKDPALSNGCTEISAREDAQPSVTVMDEL
jgi:hypothetical protein